MEWLNAHIRALNGSLQETPEVLYAVRVYVAVNILLSVVNDLVGVLRIKPVVGQQFVCHDFGAAPNVLLDDASKFMLAPRLNVLDMDLPSIAFKQPEYDFASR